MKQYKVKLKDSNKVFYIQAENEVDAYRGVKTMNDERLSPMTYKKLKELGYSSEDWQKWDQKQANEIVAKGSKQGISNSSRQEKETNSSSTKNSNSGNSNKNSINSSHNLNKYNYEDDPEVKSMTAEINKEEEFIDRIDEARSTTKISGGIDRELDRLMSAYMDKLEDIAEKHENNLNKLKRERQGMIQRKEEEYKKKREEEQINSIQPAVKSKNWGTLNELSQSDNLRVRQETADAIIDAMLNGNSNPNGVKILNNMISKESNDELKWTILSSDFGDRIDEKILRQLSKDKNKSIREWANWYLDPDWDNEPSPFYEEEE